MDGLDTAKVTGAANTVHVFPAVAQPARRQPGRCNDLVDDFNAFVAETAAVQREPEPAAVLPALPDAEEAAPQQAEATAGEDLDEDGGFVYEELLTELQRIMEEHGETNNDWAEVLATTEEETAAGRWGALGRGRGLGQCLLG